MTTRRDHTLSSPRILLSVEQAAEQLTIGRTRVYELIRTGEIESVQIGRLRRIPAVALDNYVHRLLAERLAA